MGWYIYRRKETLAREERIDRKKIGQSYELYDKSNLSLALSSEDPTFVGEVSDNTSVKTQTSASNSISLTDVYGADMPLLLKFTQALGNSFQLHVSDGVNHPTWKAKPESWYYFEDGLITCGVKKGTNWSVYQQAITDLDQEIQKISGSVRAGSLLYEDAKAQIDMCIKQYNPWQYVNVVRVEKGTLLDLSPCGIQHSWEEDLNTIPLGNVLYEIQLNVMDDVATIRSFDKGKIAKDGSLRPLQIEDYFALADRSTTANNPNTHMRTPTLVEKTSAYIHEKLLDTKYYGMDRVIFGKSASLYVSAIDTFRHVFVRSGGISITAGTMSIVANSGHSVFVPAGCREYALKSTEGNTEVLISY